MRQEIEVLIETVVGAKGKIHRPGSGLQLSGQGGKGKGKDKGGNNGAGGAESLEGLRIELLQVQFLRNAS